MHGRQLEGYVLRVVEQPGRAVSFGSAAEQYERYRPGYPEELVEAVLRYHGGHVGVALEVGAGTGKATRLFAARGVRITALEPDPDMARLLTRTTAGTSVTTVLSTCEDFAGGRRFDLLYAAAAWHWTDPATRWARAVDALAPGGVLALFGGPGDPADPALRAAVEAVEREVLGDRGDPGAAWSLEEVATADGLGEAEERAFPSVLPTTAVDFLGRLSTVSAYLVLAPAARAAALRRVGQVLPDHVDVDATVTLSLARRARP